MKTTTTTHKTLIHKQTGEFGMYMGQGQFGTSSTPTLLGEQASMESLEKFVKEFEGSACHAAFKNDATNYEVKTVIVTIEF